MIKIKLIDNEFAYFNPAAVDAVTPLGTSGSRITLRSGGTALMVKPNVEEVIKLMTPAPKAWKLYH